jgi:ubiquitin conjugation factor E4 B
MFLPVGEIQDIKQLSEVVNQQHIFCTHPRMKRSLVPLLLDLFVKCETGPTSHQFYEKFRVRHTISRVLEVIWEMPMHRQQLVSLSGNMAVFERFMNMLLNDVIYLLTEGLRLLTRIRDEQVRMENSLSDVDESKNNRTSSSSSSSSSGSGSSASGNSSDADGSNDRDRERDREREGFEREENQAKALMQLSNSIVHMLFYLTACIPDPFVSADFVERTATAITFYIDQLVGPEVNNLKVKNKEKYCFEPRTLLREIVGIFINLGRHSENFLRCVAMDERSYKPAVFRSCVALLRRRSILNSEDLGVFAGLLDKVERLTEQLREDTETLGAVPEEFEDALMGTLMSQPMTLPSGSNVDLTTIKRHLLSSAKDPFTNLPLKLEDLKPNTQLKAQIEQWLAEKRSEQKRKKAESQKDINKDKNKEEESKESKSAL